MATAHTRCWFRKVLTSSALLLLLAPQGFGQWSELAPFGGSNKGYLVRQQGALFVNNDLAGIRISMDGGSNWDFIGSAPYPNVGAFAGNGSFLFAASASGIKRSPDRGDTWETVSVPWNYNALNRVEQFLLFNDVLFCFTNNSPANGGGVYRTLDHGDSWEYCNTGQDPTEPVSAMGIMDDHLFVSAGIRFHRSVDNGLNWTLRSLRSATSIGGHNGNLVIGSYETPAGLLRSTNGGSTWTPIQSSVQVAPVLDAIVHFDGQLRGAFNRQLHRSEDGGLTWSTDDPVSGSYQVLSLHAIGDTLFAVEANRVYMLEGGPIGIAEGSRHADVRWWLDPDNGQVQIAGTTPGERYEIHLINALGKVLYHSAFTGGGIWTIPMHTTPGMHYLQLTSAMGCRNSGTIPLLVK
jgi:photosystem II stability/assembly factor-like uncharacterized protein